MEDSYANYAIDPEALRQGMEVLGLVATGVAIVATVCSPAGAAAAGVIGFCTVVGVISDSFTVGSYLAEGNVDGAWDELKDIIWEKLTGKLESRLLKWGFMKTGAELTEEEMKQVEALFLDMPELAVDVKEFILENRDS